MWWYRNQDDTAQAHAGVPEPACDAFTSALAELLRGRPRDPDLLLAMSVLVDSRVELADGRILEGTTWAEAEQLLEQATGSAPLRLYNLFSRDYGDGYSSRDDLPEEHALRLDELRSALAAAGGVTSVSPRAAAS